MHGDFSLYEVRIFVKIVEHANRALDGQKAITAASKRITADGITANIALDIREILSENTNNYGRVFDACKSLAQKEIEIYSTRQGRWVKVPDKDEKGNTHYYTHLIDNIRYPQGDGKIRFTCAVWLLNYILDIVNDSFSVYDVSIALTLPTSYSVRMYWLTCSMTKPIPYSITMLRQMLGVTDKYKTNKDFIKRCIESPMHVLESRGLNGYTYKVIKSHQGGRTSPIKALLFIPVKRQQETPKQLAAMLPAKAWVPDPLYKYLTTQCGFTKEDIAKIKTELFDFSQIDDWQDIIVKINEHARKKRASVGYYINAIRGEINEHRFELLKRKTPMERGRFTQVYGTH